MTIEEYLTELRRHLRVGPFAKRRILREIDAHLVDAAEHMGSEQSAVASFGSAVAVASRFSHRRRFALLRSLIPAVGGAAALATGLTIALGGFSGASRVNHDLTVSGAACMALDGSSRSTVQVLTVTAGTVTKVYDGTTSGTVNLGSTSLTGIVSGNDVSISTDSSREGCDP